MNKRKSLGRGLDALLSSVRPAAPPPAQGSPAPAPRPPDSAMRELPVDLLRRGKFQPRVDMREESLAELAESIKAQGVVQPIVVRPLPNPTGGGETEYEIVAGERRWRAAQLAGLATIPAVVRDIPDEGAVAVALIENIQREDLNPIEEATSLHRLVEEFGLTHEEVAGAVGRSRAAVTNLLRLLQLPRTVRELLEQRLLDMGHAKAILGLGTPELQAQVGERAHKQQWSVRETEEAVRRLAASTGGGKAKKRGPSGSTDPNIRRLEADLAERFGAAVSIEHGPKGGRVVIRYNGIDELEGILAHIK